MTRTFALAGAFLLTGCVTDPALVKVGYQGAVTRTSEKSATIVLTGGVIETVPGGMRVPPAARFNEQDQRTFVASLGDELNRLKVLRVASPAEAPAAAADVAIEIVFARTLQFGGGMYHLDVVMNLRSGERSFARRYYVPSTEGESTWDRLNTTAPQGKALAARKLMARLIPDIEAFVAGSP